MASKSGHILIIRGGAIGDFILTLPVLGALRQHFPQIQIQVLGYPHIAQLALAGGLADQMRSIDAGPLAGFFARNGCLDGALQEYFGSFDIILSYLYDPDGIFQANIARCSKAQYIVGPHRPDEMAAIHATTTFLRPLERLAIFDADPVPRLRVGVWEDVEMAEANVPQLSPRLAPATLALHPGSGSERKNWPEAKWAELLQQLIRGTTINLFLAGGEAEGERLTRLAKGLPASRVEIARNLPLTELARRLAVCAAFVGHDSGITHLAGAVGLPLVVLWGSSAEAVWHPKAEKLILVKEARGLQEIQVVKVLEALAGLLPLPLSSQA